MTATCPAIHRSAGLRTIYRAEQVVAALALLLLAPAAVVIAIVIFVLSRRSPLVSHARVGWQGAPFDMLKFRTMWGTLADARGSERAVVRCFFAVESVGGRVSDVKDRGDSRVTSRFAAFCRRHSLDELPQLYHVARGEMSLVGPRPLTRMELQTHYGPFADEVLRLRPGLTGLWQLKGRNRLTYAQRRRLDLMLVRRASAGLYVRILAQSIPKVLGGADAY